MVKKQTKVLWKYPVNNNNISHCVYVKPKMNFSNLRVIFDFEIYNILSKYPP